LGVFYLVDVWVCIIFVEKKTVMERYSMKEVLKQKFGEVEKNTKTAKSTKKVEKKGNYVVKIVDGVKYMVLK